MWLYTVVAWSATTDNPYFSNNRVENIQERQESWFCRSSSPNDGLRLLKKYSDAFKNRKTTSTKKYIVEYRLLSMVEIPPDTEADLLSDLSAHELSIAAVRRVLED